MAARVLILCFTTLLAAFVDGSLYPSNSGVVNLNTSNFDHQVLRSDNVWVVEFYAPWCGHCQKLVPEYMKAAKALMGIVKVGAVNADEHSSLGDQYGVQGFPTIKIFAIDKDTPDNYNGQRTAQGIVNKIFEVLKSKANIQMSVKPTEHSYDGRGNERDVIELTDDNFDSLVMKSSDLWMVVFFAPWCKHCLSLKPNWAKAATELKGKVKFGALDATVNAIKAKEYNIQGFPKIKAFPPGKKDRNLVTDYTGGGRTAKDIAFWAMEQLTESFPNPTIEQVINHTIMKSACEDHTLCIVAILPHILDCPADCRNSYINILTKLGENYRKNNWGWVWSDAGAQPELENAIEIDRFSYPTLAVINTKKVKYSSLRGSFSYDGINEFLRHLAIGRGATSQLKGGIIPTIFTIQPWDGKDGVMHPEDVDGLLDSGIDENKDEL